ncbi:stage II sporulation protein M [Salipaludibacillus sp. LMS25]|jgi:stage II sporulation protein M|uniref:stage II sporulation protein M n=1 Tax=Salipaludibacillus sp. LMS25 TaxID=2924031 RepID=UPI0020D19C0E|nr:stage II sporulation protein M [Salipaludibacillus sp. LMS25]UTR14557.1 stage II sporulation protein M [Salipaludibacillus sp. LMS25]
MPKLSLKRNIVIHHLESNRATYIFTTVLLIMGVIFGAIIVNSMGFSQKNDLYAYLTLFFNEASKGEFASSKEIFIQSFAYYSKMLGFIWFLGLSVIGVPIIYILLFVKGVMVGFTVGILVDQMGVNGFLFAFTSVLPQNIILIPVFITAATMATVFTLRLWRQIMKKGREPVMTYFVHYSFFILCIGIILLLVASFEAFISPHLMSLIIETTI